jgi:hypothetical protein
MESKLGSADARAVKRNRDVVRWIDCLEQESAEERPSVVAPETRGQARTNRELIQIA